MDKIKSFKSKEPIETNFLNPPLNLFEEGVEDLKEGDRFYCISNKQCYVIDDGEPINEEVSDFLDTLGKVMQTLGKTFDECIEITKIDNP